DKWRQWTPKEDEELAHSYQSGVPLEQIAMKLGRSRDAIECRASLKKLTRRGMIPRTIEWENLDDRVGRLESNNFIDDKS
ncbi:unnamed protein product, partial [marine sediment metagenome]